MRRRCVASAAGDSAGSVKRRPWCAVGEPIFGRKQISEVLQRSPRGRDGLYSLCAKTLSGVARPRSVMWRTVLVSGWFGRASGSGGWFGGVGGCEEGTGGQSQ